ncbi:hypothetical protein PIB30_023619 [Stylosanthes scabra]|uniref:Uncharacterized protein n=1 Tax=Stylosanthes scabra TaxID=79078 RepID=A0ABU6Z8Z0_9FABA|nr:hypothetical protein [Stylosanthes scabra]
MYALALKGKTSPKLLTSHSIDLITIIYSSWERYPLHRGITCTIRCTCRDWSVSVAQLDEDIKVLKAQLESAQLSVSKDQKRAESAESNSKTLAASLETAQAELAKARDEANYWCTEWKSLGTEAKEMCQETLEIVLDQVSHLCRGVDFSAITLKTRRDPKGGRIHVPEELLGDDAEVAETLAEEGMGQQ